MNFFEAIFSYVFGDGDPNIGWEEERWQTVGCCPLCPAHPLPPHRDLMMLLLPNAWRPAAGPLLLSHQLRFLIGTGLAQIAQAAGGQ